MRRDAYIQNDSGGFSVVSGIAVDEIIEDGRSDDMRFVEQKHALLLELVGDDSLPVRAVIDEPMNEDEQREWLARIRWQLHVPDGRVLLMGGFDPDVLGWWREKDDPDADGTGIAVVRVAPGLWDLDVYTYAGSMNGNTLLERGPAPAGQWFRRDHPGVPFPLWLARLLDYGGDEDPGHEAEWRDAAASVAEGKLDIDTATRGFIGLLFHLHRRDAAEAPDELPDAGWFSDDHGAREVERCPRGIRADVEDPDLVSLARKLTGEPAPESSDEVVLGPRVDVSSRATEPASALADGPVKLALLRTWHAWAISALCCDSAPSLELRVSNAAGWRPTQAKYLVVEDGGDDVVIIGTPDNVQGWALWWAMADLHEMLSEVPDGAQLELISALIEPDEDDARIGTARMSGHVTGRMWSIEAASPRVSAAVLQDALSFVATLFDALQVETRSDEERAAWETAYSNWGDFLEEGLVTRSGDVSSFNDPDVRNLVLLGQPVFRARYAGVWPMNAEDEDDDD